MTKRKKKGATGVEFVVPIDHLAPPDNVAGWVETVAYVTRDGERVVVHETYTGPDLVPEGGKVRKQLEGIEGAAITNQKKRKATEPLRQDVEAVRSAHPEWNVPRIAQWLLPRRPGDPLGRPARRGKTWRDLITVKPTADDPERRLLNNMKARIYRLDADE